MNENELMEAAQEAPQAVILGAALCVHDHVVLVVGDSSTGEPIGQIHLTIAEVDDLVTRLRQKCEQLVITPKPGERSH
jgi:hypothetical protein